MHCIGLVLLILVWPLMVLANPQAGHAAIRTIQGYKVSIESVGKTSDGGTAVSVLIVWTGKDPVDVILFQHSSFHPNIVHGNGEAEIGRQTGIPNCPHETPQTCNQYGNEDQWVRVTTNDELSAAFTFKKQSPTGSLLSLNFRLYQRTKGTDGKTVLIAIPVNVRGIVAP